MQRATKIANDFFRALLIIGISFYRYIISPMLPSACRYLPTCSEYSIDALQKYGCLKGLGLIVHRILRCHPFGGAGFDPVIKKEKIACQTSKTS